MVFRDTNDSPILVALRLLLSLLLLLLLLLLTIRLRAQVFYEQIVNEAQPSRLSLVENEGECSNCFSMNLP